MEDFENIVMKKLVDGNDPTLEILRQQYKNARIIKRQFTEVGFFTEYSIPQNIAKVENPKNFELGDISGNINGTFVTFILFIRDGLINFLEGVTAVGLWPKTIHNYDLVYTVQDTENLKKQCVSKQRDMKTLRNTIERTKKPLP